MKKHSIPNFEMRSVLLLAAFVMGGAQAQTLTQTLTSSPAEPGTPASQIAPLGSTGVIAQNRAASIALEAAFNRADTNRDGKLDRREAEHFPAMAQSFEQIDTNQDAFISRPEFDKAAGF